MGSKRSSYNKHKARHVAKNAASNEPNETENDNDSDEEVIETPTATAKTDDDFYEATLSAAAKEYLRISTENGGRFPYGKGSAFIARFIGVTLKQVQEEVKRLKANGDRQRPSSVAELDDDGNVLVETVEESDDDEEEEEGGDNQHVQDDSSEPETVPDTKSTDANPGSEPESELDDESEAPKLKKRKAGRPVGSTRVAKQKRRRAEREAHAEVTRHYKEMKLEAAKKKERVANGKFAALVKEVCDELGVGDYAPQIKYKTVNDRILAGRDHCDRFRGEESPLRKLEPLICDAIILLETDGKCWGPTETINFTMDLIKGTPHEEELLAYQKRHGHVRPNATKAQRLSTAQK